MTLTILGLQSFYFGCLAQVLCDYTGAARASWPGFFPTRAWWSPAPCSSAGLLACVQLTVQYVINNPRCPLPAPRSTILAVTGSLIMIGILHLRFHAALHATGVRYGDPSATRGLAHGRPS